MTSTSRFLFRMTLTMTLMSVLAAGAAFAEPPRGPPRDPAKREAHFQEMRGKLLRDKVGLAEADAKRAEAVFAQFDKTRKELHQRMRAAHKQLKEMLKTDVNDDVSYTQLVDTMTASFREMQELRQKEFDALRKVLTPKQQGKLLFALGKMMRHGKHFGHGGRGHGGPPPGEGAP